MKKKRNTLTTVPIKASYTSASYGYEVQDSLQFIYLGNLTNPKFLSCKLLNYIYQSLFIVDLCLSLELLQELKSSV